MRHYSILLSKKHTNCAENILILLHNEETLLGFFSLVGCRKFQKIIIITDII